MGQEMGRTLTPEEQNSLFEDLQNYKGPNDSILEEKRETFFFLRNAIAENNIGWVYHIAKIYHIDSRYKVLAVGEIASAGFLGLLDAIRKFKPSLNYKFSTYATFWIKQKIQEEFLHHTTIWIPHRIKEISRKVSCCMASTPCNMEDAFNKLCIRKKDRERVKCVLLQPVQENPEYDIEDSYLDESEKYAERILLYKNIEKLAPRFRSALEARLDGLTYREAGERLGCSYQTVLNNETAAIEQLKKLISCGN